MPLTACSGEVSRGWLPEGVTENSHHVIDFWVDTWYWALAVGVLVWGLMFWCILRYRRRKSDTGFPAQMQYNVPMEILYTVVPIFMVAVLFGKTVEIENKMLDTAQKPDVTVNVVGKQWSWDFNYVDADVHEAGQMAELDGKEGAEEALPTLYLPKGERVEFVLTSRDVIHSFWVPAFLEKMDVNPGIVNRFQVTPNQTGTFQGKCAELCGAYHSQMLFNVKVVEPAEFDKHMADLKAKGQTGLLDNGLNREKINPRDQDLLGEDDSARTSEEN